ncbi:hypothetical protein [Vespertiliibacter pulmonis]|nr:hypothetical protein [Vespertiliibacter pulmonis]
MPLILTACAEQAQQSTVPMDMKAVQEYNRKVATGNTVSPTAKQDEQELNHSDRTTKIKVYRYYPSVYPSLYYYGLGYY